MTDEGFPADPNQSGQVPLNQQDMVQAVAAEFSSPDQVGQQPGETPTPAEGQAPAEWTADAGQPHAEVQGFPDGTFAGEGDNQGGPSSDQPLSAPVTDKSEAWDQAHDEKYAREGKTEFLNEPEKGKIRPGSHLSEAIDDLYQSYLNGKNVTADFNGEPLSSREIGELGISGAYEKYFGYDKESYKEHERLERDLRSATYRLQEFEDTYKAKKEIPGLIAQTADLINPNVKGEWRGCLMNSATSLYHGDDSKAAVALMKAHSQGATADELKQMVAAENHSGGSHSVVLSIIRHFYKDGYNLSVVLSDQE